MRERNAKNVHLGNNIDVTFLLLDVLAQVGATGATGATGAFGATGPRGPPGHTGLPGK